MSKFSIDTEMLDNLTKESGSRDRTHTLRKALYLLKLATEAQAKGKRLVVLDKEGQETEIKLA